MGLNFRARSVKFCMEVRKDKKYISTKVLTTQPFFELLTSDFAWKFIWTFEPNDKKQKYKVQNKKVQKYKKNAKKCKKYKKCKKMQKCKKCKKHKKYKSTKVQKYKSKKVKTHLSASYQHNDKVQKYKHKKYKSTKIKKHLSASN